MSVWGEKESQLYESNAVLNARFLKSCTRNKKDGENAAVSEFEVGGFYVHHRTSLDIGKTGNETIGLFADALMREHRLLCQSVQDDTNVEGVDYFVKTVVEVLAGIEHFCLVTATSEAKCWGYN